MTASFLPNAKLPWGVQKVKPREISEGSKGEFKGIPSGLANNLPKWMGERSVCRQASGNVPTGAIGLTTGRSSGGQFEEVADVVVGVFQVGHDARNVDLAPNDALEDGELLGGRVHGEIRPQQPRFEV